MAKGYYRNCRIHMSTAGLKNSEVATEARVHEQSVRRAKSATAPSQDTTIQRIINALNTLHYNQNPPPKVFADEFEEET